MKAKKHLGQHFLRDIKILQKIIEAAEIKKTDTVVEIGPGEGTLTQLLLEKARKVIAIEKDAELAAKLDGNNLEVIVGDVLEVKIKEKKYKLLGNIPYYITGAIFEKFLESDGQPESLTFVIQKEVAERIMARDGKESVLSISIKAYGKPEYGGIIKAGSFVPPPKVDSAIISIRNISRERFEKSKINEKDFFRLVKRGFSHKRKLLASNLGLQKEKLAKLGIGEMARAEDLRIEDWFVLSLAYAES